MVKIEKNSFYRRNRITNAVGLHPQFKDLPSGKFDTTLTLKGGLGTTFYVMSGSLPPLLTYGEGELTGGAMRFLTSSMSMGQDAKLPTLEVFKVNSEIPITEASGTLATDGDNLLILGSYLDPDDYVMSETFDGADKRLSSSFQTIGANSELKLNNAWFSPEDAPTPWFGGGGFLGMGSNTVEENIAAYFCLQSSDKSGGISSGVNQALKFMTSKGGMQCYVKPLNPSKLKGFWVPRYDRRGKKEKWSVYKPYWKWNDIRGIINFAKPGEIASEGLGAAVEEPEGVTENNTIFNNMEMTSNQSNPYTVPADIPLLFSEANLDSSVGGSEGKSMRIYHVWSTPPDDGWDNNTLRKVENLWSPEGTNRPQTWKGSIFNIPKPGIIDMGNYPIAYGQMYADNTQSVPKFALSGIHSGTNDNRLSLPEINMRVNFKKMGPALAINYAYATGTTSSGTSSYGGPWGNMNIYYSGSGKHNKKLPDSLSGAFGAPSITPMDEYYGRFSSSNAGGQAQCYSLYTLQRAVCITFSNYKPTEEYLDDFLHNAMTGFYVSGQKKMVGGAYFISFNDFETVANTGTYNTSQSRALGFEPRGQAYDGEQFPVMEPDRVYAFPLPMHPVSNWDHAGSAPAIANSGANFRDGAGMGALGGTAMSSAEIVRVRDANPGAKEAYPQVVVCPGVNDKAGGDASQRPAVAANWNYLSVPKDSWVDLKFVFDPYAVVDTQWAAGDIGPGGGDDNSGGLQFNKEAGKTTGPLRMYAMAGERYRVGWNFDDPSEVELNDVPFINIAFPCTSSLQFLDLAGAATGTSCCHSGCWGEYYLASGTKDDSLWPKHMTVWVNNYRWTRGTPYGTTDSNEPYLDNSWAAEDLTQGISSLYQWSDYLLQPKGGDREVEFLVDNINFSYFNNVKTNSSPAVGDLKSFIKFSEGKALTAKSPLSLQPQLASLLGDGYPLGLYGQGCIQPYAQGPYTIGSGGVGIITEPKWSVVLSGPYGDDINEGVTVSGAAYRQSFTELCTGAAASDDTIWVTGNQFGDNPFYGIYQRDASWVQVGMSVSGTGFDPTCEVTAVNAGAGSGEITIDPVFTGGDFTAREVEFGPGSTGIDTLGILKLEMWDPSKTSLNPFLGGAGYTTNSGSIGAPREHRRTISIPFTGTVTTPPTPIDLKVNSFISWADTWPRYNASGNFVSRPTGYNLLLGFKDKDNLPYGSGTANKSSKWGHFLWNTYHTHSWVDISSSRDVIHPTNAFLSLVRRDFTDGQGDGSGTAMWNARALEGLGNQLGPYQLLSYYASQSSAAQGPLKPFSTEHTPYNYSGGSWSSSPWGRFSGSALSGSYFSVTTSAGDWPRSGAVAGSDGGALWIGSGSNDYFGTDGLTQKGLTPIVVEDMPGATGTLAKNATGSHYDTTNKFTNWAKREHILASAKVLAGPDMSAFSQVSKTELADNNYIMVDDASIFTPDADDEYILYLLGERMVGTDIYSGTASSVALGFSKSLKLRDVTPISDNVVFFNIPVTYMDDGTKIGGEAGSFEKWIDQLYISPKRYWLHIPYFGSDRDYNFPIEPEDGLVTTPDSLADATGASYDRTYEAIASIKGAALVDPSGAEAFKVTGSTYNESMYTYNSGLSGTLGMSGIYEHPWVLEPGTGEDTSLLLNKDYGFGTYDAEEGTGGQLTKTTALLNPAGSINRYVEFPLADFVSGAQGDLAPSDTLNMTLRSWDTTAKQEVTLYGDEATNEDYRPDLIWKFHDDVPIINEFSVSPAFDTLDKDTNLYNLTTENLNAVVFNWSTDAEDSWYNMLYISNEDILNKYHGALCYLPMNEPPTTIGDLPLTYFHTSGLASSGSLPTGTMTDMRAKIEGLAGYALKAEATDGYFLLNYKGNYTSTTGSKWLRQLTEFTLVHHIVPNYDLYIGGSNNDSDATIWNQDVTGAASGASLCLESYKPRFDMCGQSVTSSTTLVHDGITPSSIIITYKSGSTDKKDLKMFVNGQLEDYIISVASGSVNTVSGTQFGYGFYGLMEEFILYDKAYKIVDNDEYVLNTGDISEYSADFTTNKSHNAKLFVFDYHNIRGKSRDEVATSNQVSWRTTTI